MRNISEKYFTPSRILNLFIKSFANSFAGIDLIFSDSSFNIFSTSTCFFLSKGTCLFKYLSLLSQSVFLAKLAIIFLHAKFAFATLVVKFSDVNLLNSWIVIYLLWSIVILFFIIIIIYYLLLVNLLLH